MKSQMNSNCFNKSKLFVIAEKISGISLLALFFYSLTGYGFEKPPRKKQVIIGYIAGYAGIIDIETIKPEKLTHLNYAFANIRNNRVVLDEAVTDTVNLKNLNKLKLKNPNLKILISIGGWSYSGNFSDMSLSDNSRKTFAESAVLLINKYNLDGIDIDWEFPGMPGAGNIYRPEDKHNFTLLLKMCREQLNRSEQQNGKKLLLTVATNCSKAFLDHTEMNSVQAYLDYINLMAYDFLPEVPAVTAHAAGLFPSRTFAVSNTISQSIHDYLEAGVLREKMVLGIPFYGHLYQLKTYAGSAAGAKIESHIGTKGFTFIKDSLINSSHFQYRRDRDSKSAYLFNSHDKQFISFDDEWSVKQKCRYVKKQCLAGVMFWEYSSDEKAYLLREINRVIK